MTTQLGINPDPLVVHLAANSDFKCTVTATPAWPAGTSLSLVFAGTTWTSTVVGADATFAVDKATTALRPDGEDVYLLYVNGTDDLVLMLGKVQRHD